MEYETPLAKVLSLQANDTPIVSGGIIDENTGETIPGFGGGW